jgi:hypothetical protein
MNNTNSASEGRTYKADLEIITEEWIGQLKQAAHSRGGTAKKQKYKYIALHTGSFYYIANTTKVLDQLNLYKKLSLDAIVETSVQQINRLQKALKSGSITSEMCQKQTRKILNYTELLINASFG